MNKERKQHWENVYINKNPDEVSWTQKTPEMSLELIADCKLAKDAKIIDVGGGDSRLVDCLLDEGYENITVLDISEKAIAKAKLRLGDRAKKVVWIVSDILDFAPVESYDLWHDRAAFHFLCSQDELETYRKLVATKVKGNLILGTFSIDGPLKCSGLAITQYDERTLPTFFQSAFEKIKCLRHEHITPFGTTQNFIFCSFSKHKE